MLLEYKHIYTPRSSIIHQLSDNGKRKGISTVAMAAAKRAAETARRRSADYEERRRMRLRGSRVAPLRVSHITWDRPNEDLRDEFARELPEELEKVTFGYGFNGPVEGVRVRWCVCVCACACVSAYLPCVCCCRCLFSCSLVGH